MKCRKCGKTISEISKFCDSCGEKVEQENIQQETATSHKDVGSDYGIIKCGDCKYEGKGEPARGMVSKILVWLALPFAPLITVLYFVITYKYKCPDCGSTFLRIKGKDGVFKGQGGSSSNFIVILFVILFTTVLAIIATGILSSVVLASLDSAREKSRDARRIFDVKQLQLALELYHHNVGSYPTKDLFKNLSPTYLTTIPTDPTGGDYNYSYCSSNLYHLGASLEDQGNISLNGDADAQSLCVGDNINGLDSGKCSVSDSGSYCFDVISVL